MKKIKYFLVLMLLLLLSLSVCAAVDNENITQPDVQTQETDEVIHNSICQENNIATNLEKQNENNNIQDQSENYEITSNSVTEEKTLIKINDKSQDELTITQKTANTPIILTPFQYICYKWCLKQQSTRWCIY